MKSKLFKHTVSNDLIIKERLSSYLVGKIPYLETGQSVKKAIKRSQIFLNGAIGYSGDWVIGGDRIEFRMEYETPERVDVNYNVVYEDEHILIVNKPPGILSSGNAKLTLQNALKSYPESKAEGTLLYPHLVHRLDAPTAGLIICARTIQARRALGEMIEHRKIKKEYVLITEGHIQDQPSNIEIDIEGKSAWTEILEIRQLPTKDPSSYVRVRLHTGRTHQIRIHFQEIGHPLVGDSIYNPKGLSFGKGLFLMATKVEFMHPIAEKPLEVKVGLHKKFHKYV